MYNKTVLDSTFVIFIYQTNKTLERVISLSRTLVPEAIYKERGAMERGQRKKRLW